MTVEIVKLHVPPRQPGERINYRSEAKLFYDKIVKQNIKNASKKDFCFYRELRTDRFHAALHDYIASFKRTSSQMKKRKDAVNRVKELATDIELNVCKVGVLNASNDIENANFCASKLAENAQILPKKMAENCQSDANNGKKAKIGKKCPEKLAENDQKNVKNDISEQETLPFKLPCYSDISTRHEEFCIFKSQWKVIEGCAHVLEDLVYRLNTQAITVSKPQDVKHIASAVRDIQLSMHDMVPDYIASKERSGIKMVLDALKVGKIDVVEAAISFDIVGVPLPESVRLLLQKHIEPEKEDEKPMITHDEIERRRLEVLNNIKSQVEGMTGKAFEVEMIKNELKGQLSFDMEAEQANKE